MPKQDTSANPTPVAAPTADVRISIEVPVSAADYAYLESCPGAKSPSEKLAAYTKWFLTRQAGGGLMIEPTDADYLASINQGQRFESSKDIVKAVEIALNRDRGEYSFPIKLDPEYVPALEELAKFNGATVEEFLQNFCNECMANSWWASVTPENGCLTPFSEQDMLTARRVLGQVHFTGQDLAKALGKLEAFEKAQEKAKNKAA